MLTPAERAFKYYDDKGEDFYNCLELHMLHGWVVVGPDYFTMGRAVNHDASDAEKRDITHKFTKPNCWWCHFFTGDPILVFKCLPFDLPYCSYEHRNRIFTLRTQDANKRIQIKWAAVDRSIRGAMEPAIGATAS